MFERALRELHRNTAVEQLGMLGARSEPVFDRLVGRIASAFDAPIALLSISHRNRLWFKAAIGSDLPGIPRNESFCNHVLDRDDLLEVCNAAEHEIFCTLPVVSGPAAIRYYLGAGLRLSNGIGVGSLCVLDTVERSPASRDQRAFMRAMARQTEIALEFDRDSDIEHAS